MIFAAKHGGEKIHAVFRDKNIPWSIDMDGTLIDEDVTEIAVRKSFTNPIFWPFLLWGLILFGLKGPAGFYRFLENRIPMRPSREVTYNEELKSLIESHRARGGKAVLATASHVNSGLNVVEDGGPAISALFDDVWGSCMDGDEKNVLDMAAERKASVLDRFLCQGKKGFVYAGNSKDDLSVWSHPSCKGMILVNCDTEVMNQALNIPKPRLVVPRRAR